jgi:hypothetical protein
MAEAKSKKPAADKKIIDVQQGGDAASGTSRQIILNNRPIMKDPMMAEVSELANAQAGIKEPEEAETPGAPTVTRKARIIPVSHDDAKAEQPATVEEKTVEPGAAEVKTAKKTAVRKIEPLVKEGTAKTTTKAAAEPKPAEPAATKEETAAPTPETPELTTGAAAEKPADDAAAPEKTEPAEPKPEEKNPEESNEPKADESSDGPQPGRSFDESEGPAAPVDDSPSQPEDSEKDAKDKKPQLQPGELTPEQQKAFDKGEYFLPIVTTETRRMRLEILLAAIFIIIILVVWLDIMLDAGLLHVSGVHPLTHFFKS